MFDMNTYQQLLGLRFEKLENEPVWHSEVLSYKVYDSASGEIVGQFYMVNSMLSSPPLLLAPSLLSILSFQMKI